MKFNNSKNKIKTFNEINNKKVVVDYFPGFFECIKNNLKIFELCLIAKPPPKLKMLLNTKIDPISIDDCGEEKDTTYRVLDEKWLVQKNKIMIRALFCVVKE